jgi:uncharacterized damage-inducible protein DinB
MTYYGGKELAAAFRTVRDNTIKIAEEIPEDKYEFSPAPDCRSIGKTLAHIALGPGFALHVHGNKVTNLADLNFPAMMQQVVAEEAKPRNKAETIAFLKSEGVKFEQFLQSLPESFLAETVTLPPGAPQPSKTRFEMLLGTKEHEMHHRAQLMTMQRMIGQTPHLTRQMQERFAQMTQKAAAAGQ